MMMTMMNNCMMMTRGFYHVPTKYNRMVVGRLSWLDIRTITSTSRSVSSSNNNNNNEYGWDELTSIKSNTVKQFRGWIQKRKKRIQDNTTVVEGTKLIHDLLSDEQTQSLIQHVLLSNKYKEDDDDGMTNIQKLLQLQSLQQNLQIHWANEQVMEACSDTVTPQGIVASVQIPPPYSIMSSSQKKKKKKCFVILDGVSDPGNMGTILRSSVAVGVEAIVLLPNCCDVWNPKAIRSAMGASFKVPILSLSSWEECYTTLSSFSTTIVMYAATMETSIPGQSSPAHYDVPWNTHESCAIIIGNEGQGLSTPIRDDVSCGKIQSVHVPMIPNSIESLNAAVCTSVILFEYHRQLTSTTQPNTPLQSQ